MFLTFRPFNTSHEYKFKDPDTGKEFEADTQEQLIKLIVAYRAQNNLPQIEYLNMVLDHYLCRLPSNIARCMPRKDIKRGMLQYLKGGIALIQNILFDSYVDQKEADRRAEICIKCPYNIFPNRGAFVKWADDMALHSIGNRRAKRHDELSNCDACGCNLRAKVWIGGKIHLTPDEQSKMGKVQCWQMDFRDNK